jgi:hypothetical protein
MPMKEMTHIRDIENTPIDEIQIKEEINFIK